MASIHEYKLADGTRLYRVAYRKPDHSQATERGFKTKRDANEFIAALTVAKSTGTFIDKADTKTTVAALGPVWLENKKPVMKPSAFRPLEIAWRLHVLPTWGKREVGSIRHTEVQSWITALSKNLSPTSVIRAHGVLSGILENAVKDRKLSSNPSKDVTLPQKRVKPPAYLTHDQVQSLADAAGNKSGLVLFLAYTGLRWGEATGLRVKHIDTKKRLISVEENAVNVGGNIIVGTPKNHERRTVPYPEFLDSVIESESAGKTPEMLLFGKGYAHVRTPDVRSSWWVNALQTCQANDPTFPRITLHDLRHTTASLAVQAHANVKALQRMLGHKSATMTLDRYADLFDSDLNAVAVALNTAKISRNVVTVLSQSDSGQKETP
ncbi:site-specific integrase [Aurantimicrobium sp. MWH-Uga1]|uniref:site-specific integrase n=1 Tax=Aurantimicrobium sp. MWH-Uga1 TaxID=2079575 RepID=UPI000DEDC12C|nr:site-specific integrase [Aurantimicrobium sp. MWH-Uga1]AXE54075.1 transposase [Aurantimicrobium sp. MWH-Uga1]